MTMTWATKFAIHTLASCPPRPASAIFVLAMMPIELMGDMLPAFAPFATASAVRNFVTPARFPTAIEMGMSRATVVIEPGPVGADQPGERHGQYADVEFGRHRDCDGDEQRDEGKDGRVHAGGDGRRCFCSFPIAFRGSESTRTITRGALNDARLCA